MTNTKSNFVVKINTAFDNSKWPMSLIVSFCSVEPMQTQGEHATSTLRGLVRRSVRLEPKLCHSV